MRLLSNVVHGFRSLFRKTAIESEMDEELSGFVEASTADKVRRGMTPGQAIRAARAEMGSANAVKHHIRSGAEPEATQKQASARIFERTEHSRAGGLNKARQGRFIAD